MSKSILIVEDDPEIAEILSAHLFDRGFHIQHIPDGASGLREALTRSYDLIILDRMLPSLDGITLCRQLREASICAPILMLTALTQETDKIEGLNAGADDYISKPFGVDELEARINAQLRRSELLNSASQKTDQSKSIRIGKLFIDAVKRQVTLNSERIELTGIEYNLLHFLAKHPGRPFTRQELLDKVWGYEFAGYEHTVNSNINRLRNKIEKNSAKPNYILTVWGVGYRFTEASEL